MEEWRIFLNTGLMCIMYGPINSSLYNCLVNTFDLLSIVAYMDALTIHVYMNIFKDKQNLWKQLKVTLHWVILHSSLCYNLSRWKLITRTATALVDGSCNQSFPWLVSYCQTILPQTFWCFSSWWGILNFVKKPAPALARY